MVRYSVGWADPNSHLFEITMEFRAPDDRPRLHLPAWRPGRYLVQNYAANIRQWSPNMSKLGLSTWEVDARRGDDVSVQYRYYAGQLDAGSSFLSDAEVYFNGSNLFMMVEGLREEAAELSVAVPPGWPAETQLEQVGPTSYRARDYDYLIDSPFVAAPAMEVHAFEEAGASIRLVFLDAGRVDTFQFVEPVRRIVREQARMFGGLPLKGYRFIYHVRDRWHGVEHESSSSIILKRSQMLGAKPGTDGYDHFLSITSHEFFHLWNVKRILPAAFSPYDYAVETPTRLLWVMEGLTSYYGELTLVRSGLWDATRYLRHLESEVQILESSPGREFLSLSQASFDGWLQDPRQMHDKANAFVSFYNKGEVVGALLDIALRAEGRSLDELMQHLWESYGKRGVGIDETEIRRWSGPSLAEFFDRYIDGTGPLPYDELLPQAGITMQLVPAPPSLGLTLRQSDGGVVVESVIAGGGAMRAGMLPDDELLAIDGTRVRTVAVVKRAIDVAAAECQVLFSRFDVLHTARVTLESCERKVTLSLDASPDDEAKELRMKWLGAAE